MSFKVTILGSSGAVPAYGRFPSAQFLEIQNRYFLVDCGEGAQMQMMRYQLNFHRINHIFISHLHGDHYLGLPGLIFTMHLQHRTTDLHLYGHRGLDEIITTQFQYTHSAPGFKIHFHMLEKDARQIIYEDDVLHVETIPLQHKIRCSGFLFREKPKLRRIDKNNLPQDLLHHQLIGLKEGKDILDDAGNVLYKNEHLTLPPKHSRAYAYCSDTSFIESLVDIIRGVDLLYHEATFSNEDEAKALDTYHSTAYQAGRMAQLANVKRLLLGHFSARYKDIDPLLKEAKEAFKNTDLANEGETFFIRE